MSARSDPSDRPEQSSRAEPTPSPRRPGARPPELATRIVAWAADPERRDAQVGDLEEEFQALVERDPAVARRWYRRQAFRSVAPNLWLRMRRVVRARRPREGDSMMERIWADLRLSIRTLGRDWMFHGIVVATLGLGIGAVATTFSVAYGLVLDPFPFPEPDRIVGVGSAYPRLGRDLGFFENLSPAEFEDIRDNVTTLDDVVAWDMGNRQIDTEGPPENVFTAFWWGDALTTLGMDAYLGRGFTPDEVATGAAVAMLSYDLWVDRFGADSTMIGRPLSISGYPHTLVGIFPHGVDIYGTRLWTTMAIGPDRYARDRRQFQVMGRIRPSSSLTEVNAELATIAERVERDHVAEFEEYGGWAIRAETWADVSSQLYRTGVFVLLSAVSFVLLLVCANTANLLLAKARTRQREMAVRTALGADRGRLVAQVLTESLVLAVAGGLLGMAVAWLGTSALQGFITAMGVSVAGTIAINGPVLTFAAAVALSAGILFGIAPALQASSTGVAGTLQSESRSATAGVSRQRLQRMLVGVQVALAFVLLTGGGLLANSFVRVNRVESGFEPESVLTMRLTLPREKYEAEEVPAFFRDLGERVEALPGVDRAAAGSQFPGVSISFRQIFFDRPDASTESTLPTTLTTVVTRGYFEALGIPLVRGRAFGERDVAGAPNVAVINDVAARRYFPSEDPVGQRLKIGSADAETPWWQIVGVVGATRNLGLDSEPYPEVFALHDQVGGIQNQLFLVVRTAGAPRGMVQAIRDVVSGVDADQPVYAIRTAEETLQQGLAPMRATALFLSLFAGFALVLATVGIYSVVSFTVSERTREIGVHVALGADRSRVRQLVVRQALLPVLVGAAFGVAAAVGLGGALEQLLFDVNGTDPLTLIAVAVVLVGSAALASWVPAYRAARMDPVTALRAE